MLTEGGMYKLALSSNLEKAKPFRDWVATEVLPSIRKNGYYSIADQTQKILIHTDKGIQKQNSKDINRKNWIEGGLTMWVWPKDVDAVRSGLYGYYGTDFDRLGGHLASQTLDAEIGGRVEVMKVQPVRAVPVKTLARLGC